MTKFLNLTQLKSIYTWVCQSFRFPFSNIFYKRYAGQKRVHFIRKAVQAVNLNSASSLVQIHTLEQILSSQFSQYSLTKECFPNVAPKLSSKTFIKSFFAGYEYICNLPLLASGKFMKRKDWKFVNAQKPTSLALELSGFHQ